MALVIGASIGIVHAPDSARTVQGIIELADLAMYDVKRGGKSGYRYYDPKKVIPFKGRNLDSIR